jgi:hypothetical protein
VSMDKVQAQVVADWGRERIDALQFDLNALAARVAAPEGQSDPPEIDHSRRDKFRSLGQRWHAGEITATRSGWKGR